jgi:sugar transferase (PEP-CTERM/EpsH1 system associated)
MKNAIRSMTVSVSSPSRPALLYLIHRVPYPPDKGDRIRNFHLLKYLSRLTAVHLACLADEPVPAETRAALAALCERVAIVPVSWARWPRALWSLASGRSITEGAFRSARLHSTLATWSGQTRFVACLASASSMAPYLFRSEWQQVPAVIDLVDVDSQKWFDYAAASRWPKAWLYRTEGRRLRRLEQELAAASRALTVVSAVEAGIVRRFCPHAPVHVVTNGVDLDYFRPSAEPEEAACAFVGALDYRPNVEGICWFCREVWPTIHQARPEVVLYIVGRRPAPAVRQLAGVPGVVLAGQVPDVRPYLRRSAVAVVPLHLARGVQNKVLEALAMGKATVASPQALAGVQPPGETHRCATTPAEWAGAVLGLLADEPLRRRLGAAGRRYVEEHHCWDRCLEPFGALLGL